VKKPILILILVWACVNFMQAQTIITTIGGNGIGIYGDNIHDGGSATNAEIRWPDCVYVDNRGNIYIAESGDNRVRKINASGIITTIGGTGVHGFSGDGGPATDAQLLSPEAVFSDTFGNVYIADANNNRIRKITTLTGTITTIAGSGPTGVGTATSAGDGGAATNAQIGNPSGLCLDKFGNIYIADYGNNKIRKIDAITNIITTVAGTGTTGYTGGFVGYSGDGGLAINAEFSGTIEVFADSAGNLFICDQWNHAIRKVTAATGIITTIAGTGTAGYMGDGGPATIAQLNQPAGIFVDKKENIFIAEYGDGVIRRIDGVTGIISTVAGTGTLGFSGDDGPATNAELRCGNVFLDQYGTIFIADIDNNRIRKVYDTTLRVDIPNLSKVELKIYPNPTTGSITIENAKGNDVIMYDVVSKVVNRKNIISDKETVNIGSLPNGMYMIQVVDETTGIRTIRKIVKE
jgi:hypothetical protein